MTIQELNQIYYSRKSGILNAFLMGQIEKDDAEKALNNLDELINVEEIVSTLGDIQMIPETQFVEVFAGEKRFT